jgi:hypothetical protein
MQIEHGYHSNDRLDEAQQCFVPPLRESLQIHSFASVVPDSCIVDDREPELNNQPIARAALPAAVTITRMISIQIGARMWTFVDMFCWFLTLSMSKRKTNRAWIEVLL